MQSLPPLPDAHGLAVLALLSMLIVAAGLSAFVNNTLAEVRKLAGEDFRVLGVVPILVGAAVGVAVMLVTRCLDWEDVGAALSVQVIMVIVASLALGIARELGLLAEPFVLAVLFGANLSFATPMAYQTNLLVHGAGGYRFGDFLIAGVPLTVIMRLGLSASLAVIYEL